MRMQMPMQIRIRIQFLACKAYGVGTSWTMMMVTRMNMMEAMTMAILIFAFC